MKGLTYLHPVGFTFENDVTLDEKNALSPHQKLFKYSNTYIRNWLLKCSLVITFNLASATNLMLEITSCKQALIV